MLTRQAPANGAPLAPIVAATIPLCAIALGGSTRAWSQAVVLMLVGLCLVVRPPRRGPGWITDACLLGLAAFAGAGFFLPPAGLDGWRETLGIYFEDVLPDSRTPQPWLALDALTLLACGIGWFYWVAGLPLTTDQRRRTIQFYTSGIIILAIACLALDRFGILPSIWEANQRFGPFPNRNQTGNVLGLGGALAVACAGAALRRKQWIGLWFVAGLVPIGLALIRTLSRSGIGLFFAGSLLWILYAAVSRRSGKFASVGAAVVIASLCLLPLYGAKMASRFTEADLAAGNLLGHRGEIYHDALDLGATAPFLGQGLASFEPIFAVERVYSRSDWRAIHPESDWLWLWIELGAVGFGLLVGAACGVGKRLVPSKGRNDLLDAAVFITVSLFLLHGFIDVPGHRMGSVLPALLLGGLLVGRPTDGTSATMWIRPVFFAIFGACLLGAGIGWASADRRQSRIPASVAVERAKAQMRASMQRHEWDSALTAATEGIRLAPLDWQLYDERAKTQLARSDWLAALADFERARRLQPDRVDMRLEHGFLWLSIQPRLAIPLFQEALTLDRKRAPQTFGQILGAAENNPALLDVLRDWATKDHQFRLLYLSRIPKERFLKELGELRREDPELADWSTPELETLIRIWNQHETASVVAAEALKQPKWHPAAWRQISTFLASEGRHEEAYTFVHHYLPPPDVPTLKASGNRIELLQAWAADPTNYASALALFQYSRANNDKIRALDVAERSAKSPNAPSYFNYLAAEAAADLHQWDKAWAAIARFAGIGP